MLLRDGQRRAGRGGDLRRICFEIFVHSCCVDDVGGGQVAGDREHGLADLDRALAQGVLLDDVAPLPFQGPGYSRAHQELGVGGIDDRIDLGFRDVPTLYLDGGLADLALHGRVPVSGRPRLSRAFTASHARSRSSADASATVRPPALIPASTFPKRRVNFSAARRRHSSASMPRNRATLTIENSKSPNSSAIRSSSSAASASSTSLTSSCTFVHASSQRVQSKPTRAALACRRWARRRAGSAAGTPSRTERAGSSPTISSCLIRSHCASASR